MIEPDREGASGGCCAAYITLNFDERRRPQRRDQWNYTKQTASVGLLLCQGAEKLVDSRQNTHV